MKRPTALIADDEPLLRESLSRALTQLWPSLEIVATARNGREAVELFEIHTPDIVFLDVHMPGVNGVEAARQIGRRAQLVFVTAYEQYAVQAFEQGALDYVVKPVDPARLEDTVERLQERLRQQRAGRLPAGGSEGLGAMIEQLAQRLAQTQLRRLDADPQATVTAALRGNPAELAKLIDDLDQVVVRHLELAGDFCNRHHRRPLRIAAGQIHQHPQAQVGKSRQLHRVIPCAVRRALNSTIHCSKPRVFAQRTNPAPVFLREWAAVARLD